MTTAAHSLTDQELIQLVLQGNQQQFAVLVDRYQNLAFTVAFRYVQNREDAEELAQSAFVKAWQNLASYRGDARFSTWLYTIVSSVALSFLRKKKLDVHHMENEQMSRFAGQLATDEGHSHRPLEQQTRAATLQQAIGRMAPDDARVLTLFYQAEQSLDEIGLIMGIDPNTAKVKLHRARQRLRTLLETQYAYALKDWREP